MKINNKLYNVRVGLRPWEWGPKNPISYSQVN